MTTFGIIFLTIIATVIFILCAYIAWSNEKLDSFADYILVFFKQCFFTLFGGLVFLLIFMIITAIEYSGEDRYYEKSSKTELNIYSINISNGFEMNGSFILGSGYVDGETYNTYRFYTNTKDDIYKLDVFKLETVNADNFNIVCTDTVSPHIEYYNTECFEPNFGLFFKKTLKTHITLDKAEGIIYLPTNSIIQNYQIKL
jgi:hypothetical protein